MNTEREKTDALSDAVEIDNNKPEGATHYTRVYDEIWYLRWSSLISIYLVYHDGIYVPFLIPKSFEIKPL